MNLKEKYEALINNATLFDTDKEKDPVLYDELKFELIETIAEYYRQFVWGKKTWERFGLELIETADSCIKYFNKKQGDFLHYFNTSLKNKTRASLACEFESERSSGIKIAKKERQLLKEIKKIAGMHGLDLISKQAQQFIAQVLGMGEDEVEEIVFLNFKTSVERETSACNQEDDDDEFSWKQIVESQEFSPERLLVDQSMRDEMLDSIEEVFNKQQARQKPMLSMLLTASIVQIMSDQQVPFFDKAFYDQKVVNYFNKNNYPPSAKMIANWFGVSEPSISRSFNGFKIKLFTFLVYNYCKEYYGENDNWPTEKNCLLHFGFNLGAKDKSLGKYFDVIEQILLQLKQ